MHLYTLSRAKANGSINFDISLKLDENSVDPPKPLYFLCNSFSLRLTKSSETKTFSQKVMFMFCLEHFSLKCIIIFLFFP